ncbi:hypothetical protein Tco_0892300 [Tanacetum coccineum]|uniref:Retrotransposon gag domain-containing protein n=1 Tax=Tanacetum coccineum TaxID=301880 RepID=A0ABQ5C8R2_9ASTR
MNDDALTRLMVTEMTAQEIEERLAFIEIKRREVECREREVVAQEYRAQQEYIRFYLQSYDHLIGDQRMAMDEARAKIKTKLGSHFGLKKMMIMIGAMAGVDINTLTMEQYLALSRKSKRQAWLNQKSEDAVLLRVFSFTLTGTTKRWVDRLTPGAVNTWDLLKRLLSKGPHLDKECPLNEEVKQVEEAKYREFGRPAPFNGESARRSMEKIEWIKKLQESTRINTRHQSASLKNLETQIEQLTKELHSRATDEIPSSSTRQCKVVNDDLETQHRPISSRNLINKEGWTTKDLQCQLPPKELNLRNFTLSCTIGNFNFYGMADLGASINVMPRNIFEYLKLAKLRNTNMLVEMVDMTKKGSFRPFLATIHAEINVFDKEISLGTNNDRVSYDMEKKDHNFTIPAEKIFMIKSDLDNKPLTPASSNNQPRISHDRLLDDSVHDQNRKKIKIKLDQHIPRAHFCKPVKQTIDEQTKMWPTCGPTKEIGQLADEYEIEIGKKGHILDKIWEYYESVHRDNTYWWHDHGLEEEERKEMGIKI